MPDRPVRLLQLGARLVDGALLRLAGRLIVGGDRGLTSVTSVPSVAGCASAFCSRGSALCENVFMSTSSVGEAAHFGRRESAFFGRTSVIMSALSIGDAACFGRVSAFFGRASVLPALGRAFVLGLCALPAFVGLAATEEPVYAPGVSALFGRASVLPALGRSFVLVLGARPMALVGPAAVEVSVDQRLVLLQVAEAAARPSIGQRLVVVCVAVALLWLELVLPCGRVAVALLWLTVCLPCG